MMEQAFNSDLLIYDLLRGILHGYWTLEDLDNPSPGWEELENDRAKSIVPRDHKNPHDRRMVPVMKYQDAGSRRPFNNICRAWVTAHPAEWQKMIEEQATAELSDND